MLGGYIGWGWGYMALGGYIGWGRVYIAPGRAAIVSRALYMVGAGLYGPRGEIYGLRCYIEWGRGYMVRDGYIGWGRVYMARRGQL